MPTLLRFFLLLLTAAICGCGEAQTPSRTTSPITPAAAEAGSARPAAGELIAKLGDPRPEVRSRAAQAILDLSRRGDALLIVENLTEKFTDADVVVREGAIDCVVRISAFGHTEKVVDHLSAVAAAENVERRVCVAKALSRIGGISPPAEVTLRSMLADPAVEVRAAAATGLGSFGGVSEKTVPALLQLVEDPNNEVVYAALRSLSQVGPREPEAVELMRKLLQDKDVHRRELAAAVLWRMGERAKPALPELTVALASDEPVVKVHVLGTLGMLGPPSPAIEQAIFAATHDPEPLVRAQAAVALGRVVRNPKTMATLTSLLPDENAHVRYCALTWLMTFREQAGGALPDIVRRLGDEDEKVREAAQQALTLVGPAKSGEVAAVAGLLLDSSPEVRGGARRQLVDSAKRGGTRTDIVTALRKMRKTVDTEAGQNLDALLREIESPVAPREKTPQ
ncbi:MAG: HEAT repeat domain-containing protein [Planctomycetes bacterium]|nr:HEAT repeat domain-containing protein [Planctomycetota bacterium]